MKELKRSYSSKNKLNKTKSRDVSVSKDKDVKRTRSKTPIMKDKENI